MTSRSATAVPAHVVSAADYEREAQARLPADVWSYIAGAGADGLTQRWNRAAFDNLKLCGRALANMESVTTESTLLGAPLPFPIIIAPVAFQKLAHPDGELATVLGASACSAWMTISTLSSTTIEDIAKQAQTIVWFQLYFQASRESTLKLVRRAEAAGCKALIVTVDAPVNGVRNDEQRSGFQLSLHAHPANLDGAPGPISRAGPGESPVFKGLLDNAPTWTDIAWLRTETRLPLLLKGIMHPGDAERAVSEGADGIIISNHGGRTLDTLPASIEALEVVAARVGNRVPLLFDGGIRRGTDVLKALALGARAVMLGQPIMHALAVAGAVGVVHLLTILRAELEVAMTLTGCASLAHIDRGVLWNHTKS